MSRLTNRRTLLRDGLPPWSFDSAICRTSLGKLGSLARDL